MALLKRIQDRKGMVTNYHRVSSFLVDKDNDIIKVNIKQYSDKDFRDKEIQSFVSHKEIDESIPKKFAELERLTNKLQIYVEEDGSIKEKEKYDNCQKEIEKVTKEIDELNSKKNQIGSPYETVLNIAEEELPFDSKINYSFTQIYNQLKELDAYQNAENI